MYKNTLCESIALVQYHWRTLNHYPAITGQSEGMQFFCRPVVLYMGIRLFERFALQFFFLPLPLPLILRWDFKLHLLGFEVIFYPYMILGDFLPFHLLGFGVINNNNIRNWPLPIGAFQDQCKQIVINKHNMVKNPNWREADQLAIYKRRREVELGATENNVS